LFTPSCSPQFSPIENMFAKLKKKLRDYQFKTKEKTAVKISEVMFGMSKI